MRPPIVAQYAAEAFAASDRSLACLPERERHPVSVENIA
jgi:hypothetical protein